MPCHCSSLSVHILKGSLGGRPRPYQQRACTGFAACFKDLKYGYVVTVDEGVKSGSDYDGTLIRLIASTPDRILLAHTQLSLRILL